MAQALSNQEREVVRLLLQGKSNKLIALSLGISDRTVEFHLKNIYAKARVSSRVELILKLGDATGRAEMEKLGYSTVDRAGESAENRDTFDPSKARVAAFRNSVSSIGKEWTMKNLLSTKHVPLGVITALFTGFLWVALLSRFAHMSLEDIRAWILPSMLVWVLTGLLVGWIGKRNGNTPLKICFSILFGMGASPLAILPLMGFVVLPLGKFAEWLGFLNPATISSEAATMFGVSAMLVIWLVLGLTFGSLLLWVTIRKPEQSAPRIPAPEQRL